MSLTTETSVLRDDAGVALAVQDGVAIPAGTPALLFAFTDGTNSQFGLSDSTGRQVIVGAGVAGTPAGGVASVQGVSGGTALNSQGTGVAGTPAGGVLTVQGDPAGTPIPVTTTETPSTTATRTSPTVTNVVSTVLAANTARLGATFFSDGTGNVYLALGAAATTTDFTVRLTQNDYYEVPADYNGIITAIRSAGSSTLRVTELT